LALFDPDYYLSEVSRHRGRARLPDRAFRVLRRAGEPAAPQWRCFRCLCRQPYHCKPAGSGRPHFGYLRATGTRRVRLLFTSHDASRSGAPAIILSLIRSFAEHANAECFTILDRGGELLPEFQRHSHVMVMSKACSKWGRRRTIHDRDIRHLMGLLGDNPPAVALSTPRNAGISASGWRATAFPSSRWCTRHPATTRPRSSTSFTVRRGG
jgi:hypothetical protein